MQSQIDGNITTYYYSGVPTLSNLPASEWTTDTDRDKHIGDLYYDKTTGYAYRFYFDQETLIYGWLKITDSDVTEALAIANAAQDTADAKRRVFVVQPTTPYDIGDIWLNDGDMYRCKTTRASGNFQSSDWILATKYTDDSTANAVNTDLQAYKLDVQNVYATKSSLTTTENEIRAEVTRVEGKADSKAQVFRTTPTVPYYVNDIYIHDNDVYMCTTERLTGVYTPSDWSVQVDYGTPVQQSTFDVTIDGITNRVSSAEGTIAQHTTSIQTAQTTANNAQTSANTANTNANIALERTEIDNSLSNYPIEITDAGEYTLDSVQIDGNLVQNGTPTPEAPVEVEVVKGLETATDDVPIGNIGIKVVGKNLNNGIDYKFYITGTGTQYKVSGNDTGLCIKIDGTSSYTISTTRTQTRYRVACSNSLPSTTAQDCHNGVVNDGTNNNITINTNGYKYLLVNATDLSAIQIEKGSTATDYEPYQEQISPIDLQGNFLGKIGNVKDELKIVNNHAVLTKRIGKVVLDGSETWQNNFGTSLFGTIITNHKNNATSQAYSNCYTFNNVQSGLDATLQHGEFAIQVTQIQQIYIKNTNYTTINEFKNWLSTHNTEVYYEFATSTEIDLGEIVLPNTYKDYTLIELLSSLEPSNMAVKYLTDSILNARYTTKSELEIAKDFIKSEVSETYSTKEYVNGQIDAIKSTYTIQTADDITDWFQESGNKQLLNDLQGSLNQTADELVDLKAYVRRKTYVEDGVLKPMIILGDSTNETTLQIKENIIEFMSGGSRTAYISNDKLYIEKTMIIKRQQLGNWVDEVDSFGNINTYWVGE